MLRWTACLWACIAADAVRADDETKDLPPIPFVEIKIAEPLVFDKHVFPILDAKCTTCHDREGGLAEGGLDLLTVESLLKGGKHGPSLIAQKGEESALVLRAGNRQKPYMPPEGEGDPLSAEELSIIKTWIDQGAKPGSNLQPAANRKREVTFGEVPAGVHPVYALRVSTDGKMLAAGRGRDVAIYDVATGEKKLSLSGHRDLVHSLAFSPDSQWLAAGGYEETLLWKITAGGEPPQWTAADPISIKDARERVLSLAFSSDGKWLAIGSGVPSASGVITLWDRASQAAKSLADIHSDAVFSLEFSPDSKRLASTSADKFLRVTLVETGKMEKAYEGHTGYVLDVGWKSDGAQLATSGADAKVKIWGLESGEQIRTIDLPEREVVGVGFITGGPMLLAAGGDRVVRRINADNGKVDRGYEGAAEYLMSMDVSADGKIVAAGSHTGEVTIWNGDDGKVLKSLAP